MQTPRGVTLIEMCVVLGILGVLAALAVVPLADVVKTWRAQAEAEPAAAFVESARQLAVSEGRCHRVVKVGESLAVERRLSGDCFNLDAEPAAWKQVAVLAPAAPASFDLAGQSLTTPPGLDDDDHRIIFRPNGRLWGDGDVDTSDDGARVLLRSSSSPEVRAVDVMAVGRVCVKNHGAALPALSVASVRCP